MRDIKYIVIHCTATPEGRPTSLEDVTAWHKQLGWRTIGYHYLILLDGTVKAGRNESEVGSHTAGYNSNSIGICYVGGMDKDMKHPKDTRTAAQKEALKRVILAMKKKYPNAEIKGHRDFPNVNKACPSFDVAKWLKENGI
jgi:N-acetylmuramoyl-L-alanine amidase